MVTPAEVKTTKKKCRLVYAGSHEAIGYNGRVFGRYFLIHRTHTNIRANSSIFSNFPSLFNS